MKGWATKPFFVGMLYHEISGEPTGFPNRFKSARCKFCGFFPKFPADAMGSTPLAPCWLAPLAYS